MKQVYVICGLYGDEDFTPLGVFSSAFECDRQISRLKKAFDGTLWRFYYESTLINDTSDIDLFINNN